MKIKRASILLALFTVAGLLTSATAQSAATPEAAEGFDAPGSAGNEDLINSADELDRARESARRGAVLLAEKHARELAYREARETAKREAREAALVEKDERDAPNLAEREAQETVESAAREAAERDAIVLAMNARESALRGAQEAADREAREGAERDAIILAERTALECAQRNAQEMADREVRELAMNTERARVEAQESAEREDAALKARQSAEEDARELDENRDLESAEKQPEESAEAAIMSAVREVRETVRAAEEEEKASQNTDTAAADDIHIDDESHEEDVMQEIMAMQQRELADHMEEVERIKHDHTHAEEAERVAKESEAREAVEAARLEKEAAASKKKQATAEDAWVLKSRPGAEAKPGAKLGQTATASAANRDAADDRSGRASRDRVPESLRKESKSAGKGNFFGGQSEKDKEAEARRREAQQKAKETDKISAGAGNRRREIEAKLSPQMRKQAAAEQQKRAEEEQEGATRRARASVARKFARPVEKVLSVYNSQTTDLYDVLEVGKNADEGAIKKAYRRLALRLHPDKNAHPDSKMAFDAIQEAFETLSSLVKRTSYNAEQRKLVGKPSIKKALRSVSGGYQNVRSRLLLFWVRVFRRGELGLEFQELIGDSVVAALLAVGHAAEHFVLLPSMADRVRLMSEMLYDSRTRLVMGACLAALL